MRAKRLKTLFATGLDTITISFYDGPEQYEHFEKIRLEAGLSKTQMAYRRRYYEDGNYGITVSALLCG